MSNKQRTPNLFIVGAPKSGTTAMHEYLKAHPAIYMSAYKEPYYFGSDLQGTRIRQIQGKTGKYLALFHEAQDEKWVGESSNWYLYSKKAAEEIKAYDPAARIIIMLRSPIEMSYSMYYQSRYTGNEVLETFEEALDAEADRRAGKQMPPMSHTPHGLFYTDICLYAGQVKRYFDVFGRDCVHVIIYDDFKKDTAGSYRQTLEFLEVDPTFTTDFKVINANKSTRTGLLQKALLRIGISPMLLKDQITYFQATNRWVPERGRGTLLSSAVKTYTRYEKRPPLSEATRQRLQQLFLPDVEQLSELLGRDLTHWCRRDTK